MPARASQKLDARSQELTKNLVNTRNRLEGHFKSIKRRDRDFRLQKLANFEEELKAKARIERESHPPQRVKSQSSETWTPAPRSSSSAPALLKRSSRGLDEPISRVPHSWGGHGVMPKPSGSPAAFPQAVSRSCADTPACMHPPPHPGAHSMNPANTRSMKAFSATYGVSHPPMPTFPRSPTGQLLVPGITPGIPGDQLGSTSIGSTFREGAADNVDELSGRDEMTEAERLTIKRLGNYMALLGPRYKTISKEMIWEKAERGERTALQRRMHKLGIEPQCKPDTSLRLSSSAPGSLSLASDSDGRARAAWLAARAANRDHRGSTNKGN